MKIASINGGVFGSTGKIVSGIARACASHGDEYFIASPITSSNKNEAPNHSYIRIGTYIGRRINVLLSRITGLNGCFSLLPTWKLIRELRRFAPDVLQLHVLHDSYINLPILFRYVKKEQIPIVWTFHDCWAFTGHCPHFSFEKCDKWKTGCGSCPRYRAYPQSLIDNSAFMWKLKRRWFSGIYNMTIVTPSEWLGNLVGQSFMSHYPVKVIHNGISLKVFRPVNSSFREDHGISYAQFLILGVAFGWDDRKGLDVFLELARRLDSRIYRIVLVGTDDSVDSVMPDTVISVHRTQNQRELAEIYSAADLFVNPSREENYPTVSMEALACGTPVLTFRTGGSTEIIDGSCGSSVSCGDVDGLTREIIRIHTERPYDRNACLKRAEEFDDDRCFEQYVELYRRINDRITAGRVFNT